MLSQIIIEKLFGTFDYRIDLKTDGLTVLIGPNGYGKTTILRIVNEIAKKNILFFVEIPFKKITFVFDNENPISIEKTAETKFRITADNHERNFDIGSVLDYITKDFPFLERSDGKWYDIRTERFIDFKDVLKVNGLHHYLRRVGIDGMEAFFKLKFPEVYLIREQRLLSKIENEDELEERRYLRRSRSIPKPIYEESIEKYSISLIEIMDHVDSKYAEKSRELDSSYPRRLFESSADIQELEFRERFDQIKETQRSLREYGLSVTHAENPPEFDSSNAKALRVYLDDVEEKLKVFSPLLKTLNLFSEILNSRRFANKRISISKDYGLRFVSNDGTFLELTNLSSGEQHEVVLLFDLLFHANSNTLVLIDEPEISLHIAWQKAFLSDLLKIIDLRKISIMVATHSPQIINDRWENVVDLGGEVI